MINLKDATHLVSVRCICITELELFTIGDGKTGRLTGMLLKIIPSDEHLRNKVVAALAENPQTSHLPLRVGVMNAIVHLAGIAPTQELWQLAELLAAGIPGVRGVVNRIEAPGAPPPTRTIHLNIGK